MNGLISEEANEPGDLLDSSSADYVRISKTLANCLRHKATEMGIDIGVDGYVRVADILAHPDFHDASLSLIERIVADCPKQRFQLTERNGEVFVRATQGHSIPFIQDDLLLTRINDAAELPVCLHGTYHSCLPAILESGLNRMNLNHIHMSTSVPGSSDFVLSGMRENTEVVIEIDVDAAMRAGIVFYRSLNGVILSRGLESSGIIPPSFFRNVNERILSKGM